MNLLELKGFRAPDFLLKKIRAYMSNLRAEPLDDLSGLLEMELLQDDGEFPAERRRSCANYDSRPPKRGDCLARLGPPTTS